MESSNVTIDNIIHDIALKIIDHCYKKTLNMVYNDEIELGAIEYNTEKITNALLNCKNKDILREDIIKIQNIIQEKDEKIKETENRLKEIQDINIKLTTDFNNWLDKMNKWFI